MKNLYKAQVCVSYTHWWRWPTIGAAEIANLINEAFVIRNVLVKVKDGIQLIHCVVNRWTTFFIVSSLRYRNLCLHQKYACTYKYIIMYRFTRLKILSKPLTATWKCRIPQMANATIKCTRLTFCTSLSYGMYDNNDMQSRDEDSIAYIENVITISTLFF